MKLLRRFTNKGECRRLVSRIKGEKEYLLFVQINDPNSPFTRVRFERWQKMRYWLDQLTK